MQFNYLVSFCFLWALCVSPQQCFLALSKDSAAVTSSGGGVEFSETELFDNSGSYTTNLLLPGASSCRNSSVWPGYICSYATDGDINTDFVSAPSDMFPSLAIDISPTFNGTFGFVRILPRTNVCPQCANRLASLKVEILYYSPSILVTLWAGSVVSAPVPNTSYAVIPVTPNVRCSAPSPSKTPSISITSTKTPTPPPPSPTPTHTPTSTKTCQKPQSNAPIFSVASGAASPLRPFSPFSLSGQIFPSIAGLALEDYDKNIFSMELSVTPCNPSLLALCWGACNASATPVYNASLYSPFFCILSTPPAWKPRTATEALEFLVTASFTFLPPLPMSIVLLNLSLSITNNADPSLYCTRATGSFNVTGCPSFLVLSPPAQEASALALEALCFGISNSSLVLTGPGVFSLPQPSTPLATLVEGSAFPSVLWGSNISAVFLGPAPPTVTLALVDIALGCTGAEVFTFSQGAFPATGVLSASPCNVSASGTSIGLDGFLAFLRTVALQITSANPAPLGLQRLIRVQLFGASSTPHPLASAFSTLLVRPVNDPAVPMRGAQLRIGVPEGALPDFAVVILASCQGVSRVHGLPVLCLEDPDPPFVRATGGVDAYAGPDNSPLSAVLPASTYTISFSTPTLAVPESYPCSVSTVVQRVGQQLFDCSPAAPSDSVSAPTACVFQRFRLSLSSAAPVSSSASRTPSSTVSITSTQTPTVSQSPTSSLTSGASQSQTPTRSPTPTSTPTPTPTPSNFPLFTFPFGSGLSVPLAVGGVWRAPAGGCDVSIRIRGGGGGGKVSFHGYNPGGHAAEFNVSFFASDTLQFTAQLGLAGASPPLNTTNSKERVGSAGGGGASALLLFPSKRVIAVAGGGGGGAEGGVGGINFANGKDLTLTPSDGFNPGFLTSTFSTAPPSFSSGGNAGLPTSPGSSAYGTPGSCSYVGTDVFSSTSSGQYPNTWYGAGRGGGSSKGGGEVPHAQISRSVAYVCCDYSYIPCISGPMPDLSGVSGSTVPASGGSTQFVPSLPYVLNNGGTGYVNGGSGASSTIAPLFFGGAGGGGYYSPFNQVAGGGGSGFSSYFPRTSTCSPNIISCGGGGGASYVGSLVGGFPVSLSAIVSKGGALRYNLKSVPAEKAGNDCKPKCPATHPTAIVKNGANLCKDTYYLCAQLRAPFNDANFSALDGEVALLSCIPRTPTPTPSSSRTPSTSGTPSVSPTALPPSDSSTSTQTPTYTPSPSSSTTASSSSSPTPTATLPPIVVLTSNSSTTYNCTTCALDFEALYCDAWSSVALLTAQPPQLAFTADLYITDTLFSFLTTAPLRYNISLFLEDVPEPTAVLPLTADIADLLSVGLSPNAFAPLEVDDRTGLPASPNIGRFLMCTQDGAAGASSRLNLASQLRFEVTPAEGAAGLPQGSILSSLLTGYPVGDAQLFFVDQVPVCTAALLAQGATIGNLSSGIATVWLQAFSVQAVSPSPYALGLIAARSLTVKVWATPGVGALPSSPILRLRLVRTNYPVTWNPGTLSALQIAEGAPVDGRSLAVVSVTDLDEGQNVSLSIASITVLGGPLRTPTAAQRGLFVLSPIFQSTLVTDAATGVERNLTTVRSANVQVGLDAVYGCKSSPPTTCTFTLTLVAQDTGDFSASHSLLPPASPTSQAVTLTITMAPGPNPIIFSNVTGPPGGLSAGGGDVIDIFGTSLSLPGGNATAPVQPLSGSLFTPGDATPVRFPLVNCTSNVRLAWVRCVSSPGWSNASRPLTLFALVGGQQAQLQVSIPTNLLYAPQQALAVSAGDGGLPTLSSTVASLPLSQAYVNSSIGVLLGGASSYALPASSFGWSAPPTFTAFQPSALGAAALFQGNFSLLVGNTPPLSLLSANARCVALHALLVTSGGMLSPIGRCQQRQAPSSPGPSLSQQLFSQTSKAGGSSLALGLASTAAALSSAALFDCPLPRLSGGAWHSVAIAAEVRLVADGLCSLASFDFSSSGGLAFTSPALLPDPYQAAYRALLRSYAGRGVKPTPIIISVSQAVPGGRFTVSLGSTFNALLGEGGLVEYFLPACSPTREASCASHRGQNCVLKGLFSVECDMDPDGWGRGFSVRLLLGGAASPPFFPASPLSYALPGALAVFIEQPLGSAQALTLPPFGGGLLELSGTGLWPPSALTISIGGVGTPPINFRDISAFQASLSHAASRYTCASAIAAGLVPGATACFEDPYAPFSPTPRPAPPPLALATPPGFGTVTIAACLGSSQAICATINVSYSLPTLTGVALLGQAVSANPLTGASTTEFSIAISATSLTPCLLCIPRAGEAGLPLPPLSPQCNFKLGRATLSPTLAASRAAPFTVTGEGRLPTPLVSTGLSNATLPIASCSLPSSLWVWGPGGVRTILYYPSVDLTISSASGPGGANETLPLPISFATFSALERSDSIALYTALTNGVIQLTFSLLGAGVLPQRPQSVEIYYDRSQLTTPDVAVTQVLPSTWEAQGRQLASMVVNNAGKFGALRLYPEGTLSNATRPDASTSGGQPLPLPKDLSFICPIIANTTITFYDDQGSSTTRAADDPAWGVTIDPSAAAAPRTMWYLTVGSDGAGRWQASPVPPPCYIVTWEGCEVPRNNLRVSLFTPTFVGALDLVVQSSGTPSVPFTVNYRSPVISSITPSGGPTNGSLVTLLGSNFGALPSLGRQWAAATRGTQQSVGNVSTPGAAATAVPASAGPAMVVFTYTGSLEEPFRRACAPLLWSDTRITCLSPEGVSGSINLVTIALAVPTSPTTLNPTQWWREVQSPPLQFQYSFPALSTSPPPLLRPFRNRTLVTIYGASLTRVNLPPPPGASPQELAAAALPLDFAAPADASAAYPFAPLFSPLNFYTPTRPYWRPYVYASVSSSEGLVQGLTSFTLPPEDVLVVNHTSISFLLPLIEGTVPFFIRFTSSDGVTWPPASLARGVPILAPAPVITGLSALQSEAFDDANPCESLGAPVPPNSTRACILLARAVHPEPPPRQPPNLPCLRANASASGSPPQVLILGLNFGSGSPLYKGTVFLVPTNATTPQGEGAVALAASALAASASSSSTPPAVTRLVSLGLAVPCTPIQGSSVWFSGSALRCALAGGLPRGDVVVLATVAYALVNSTPSNVTLQPACPCGSFAEVGGQYCQRCPQGASCGGGLDRPRSLPQFWETIPSEWLLQRNIDPIIAGVPRFVACPTPKLCTGDQTCAPGSGEWMCSACLDGFARGYDGFCSRCSREASLGVVLGVPLALAALALLLWRYQFPAFVERTLLVHTVAYFHLPEGLASSPPPVVPIGVLLKQGLTFLQTFGALAGFVTSSRLRREFVGDIKLIPNFLAQFEFFGDLGLNASIFKCAVSIGSTMKIVVIMLLPIVCSFAWAVLEAARAWAVALRLAPPFLAEADLVYLLLLAQFIVVPMSVSGLARMQSCADISVGGYLLDDPRVSCYSPNFVSYQAGGKVMAALYIACLGGVVLLLRGWFDCSERCQPSRAKDSYLKFLTEAFKKEGFWPRTWEALTMLRKLLLLGLSTGLVYFKDGRMQILAVLMLLSLSISGTIYFQPYVIRLVNQLDLLGLFATLAVCFSVSCRVTTAMAPGFGISVIEQFFFDLAALATCVPFMAMWAFLLLDTLLFAGRMAPAFEHWAHGKWEGLKVWAWERAAGAWRACRRCFVKDVEKLVVAKLDLEEEVDELGVGAGDGVEESATGAFSGGAEEKGAARLAFPVAQAGARER